MCGGMGSVGKVLFEQVDKAVVWMGVADGAELPAIVAAIDLAEDHGALAVVGGCGAEGVAGHFAALAIHGTDVGGLHLAEVLALLDALVDAHEEQDAMILRGHGVQPHHDLLIVIRASAADAVVPAVRHGAAGMLAVVEEHDIASHELAVPAIPHLVTFIHEEGDGIEVELRLVLRAKDASEKSLFFLPHLPAEADGDLVEIVGVFAQINRLSFGEIDGHERDACELVSYLLRILSQRAGMTAAPSLRVFQMPLSRPQ